tara:strand:+ start:13360 stop:13482 length:123 start_codon:yes stop_codon:yes gene_type:complete
MIILLNNIVTFKGMALSMSKSQVILLKSGKIQKLLLLFFT